MDQTARGFISTIFLNPHSHQNTWLLWSSFDGYGPEDRHNYAIGSMSHIQKEEPGFRQEAHSNAHTRSSPMLPSSFLHAAFQVLAGQLIPHLPFLKHIAPFTPGKPMTLPWVNIQDKNFNLEGILHLHTHTYLLTCFPIFYQIHKHKKVIYVLRWSACGFWKYIFLHKRAISSLGKAPRLRSGSGFSSDGQDVTNWWSPVCWRAQGTPLRQHHQCESISDPFIRENSRNAAPQISKLQYLPLEKSASATLTG